jgi:hypothetical protein
MRTYRLSELVSVAMPAATGVMLFTGILLWKSDWVPAELVPWLKPLCLAAFAVMGVSAVAAGACMAAHAMAAHTAGGTFKGLSRVALVFSAGFALVGALGVHIGWEVLTKASMAEMALPSSGVIVAASLFLAFAKNAFWFVLEGRKQVDRWIEAEADKALRSEVEQREARQDARSHLSLVRGIGPLAAAAALAGAGMASAPPLTFPTEETAQAPSPEASKSQSAELVPVKAPAWVQKKLRARYEAFAAELNRSGGVVLQAARVAGVPSSTAFYWSGRLSAEKQSALA